MAGWVLTSPVSIYEHTNASSDCPQSEWRVHQQATTAGVTYILDRQTHMHTSTHTHTSVSAMALFLSERKIL